jgi:hypothetical protein
VQQNGFKGSLMVINQNSNRMKNFYLMAFALIFFNANDLSAQFTCVPTAIKYLDTNNVRCAIFNSGDHWWDLAGTAKYEIPKGSGKTSLFAGSLWIGGYDSQGNLHVAGNTYRQGGMDYWPGPIQKNVCALSVDTVNCTNYDSVWSFKKADILNFINSGIATSDILSYPANGNVAAGELPILAPFYDANSNGIYEPTLGDYPLMDLNNSIPDSVEHLYGDQCLYYIFNDTALVHSETHGAALGIEVHAQAFAFASTDPAINNATFYRYKIINRSCNVYDSVFIGHFIDPDLGHYTDDYIGCDVGRDLGFCFNGDFYDDPPSGYGYFPPAVGCTILQGPTADLNDGIDNNHNGTIDEPGEQNMMTRFMTYNNDFTVTGNPQNAADYYQYMSGSWQDGVRWTYGGNAYNPGSTDYCYYFFPDTTDPAHPGNQWNEITAGNAPMDVRFLMSSGPFTLHANECTCLSYAVLWARDSTGNINNSVDSLKAYADRVKNMFSFTDCPCANATNIAKQNNKVTVSVLPNPMNSSCIIKITGSEAKNLSLTLFNTDGKKVEEQNSHTSQFVIEKKSKILGVYFYQIKSENSILTSGKLVVQ